MGQSQPRSRRKWTGGARCPICGAPSSVEVRPFCSARCADVDLSRWLGGGYAIAGGQQDSDEDGDDTQAAQRPGEAGADGE